MQTSPAVQRERLVQFLGAVGRQSSTLSRPRSRTKVRPFYTRGRGGSMAPPCVVSSVYYRDARSTCAGNMTTSTVDKRVFCFPASNGFTCVCRCLGRGLEATRELFVTDLGQEEEASLARFRALWRQPLRSLQCGHSTDLCFSALQDPKIQIFLLQ